MIRHLRKSPKTSSNDDAVPLLSSDTTEAEEGSLRRRSVSSKGGLKPWQTVFDPNRIPRDPPDQWWCVGLQIGAIVFAFLLAGYAWFYFEHMHFNITHLYADLGYAHAQHVIGHKYLRGKGTPRHHGKAMEYFRKAADQGHPHAAYNLAVGHMQGMPTDLKPGEAHELMRHAAKNGVDEAHRALENICANGGCQ